MENPQAAPPLPPHPPQSPASPAYRRVGKTLFAELAHRSYPFSFRDNRRQAPNDATLPAKRMGRNPDKRGRPLFFPPIRIMSKTRNGRPDTHLPTPAQNYDARPTHGEFPQFALRASRNFTPLAHCESRKSTTQVLREQGREPHMLPEAGRRYRRPKRTEVPRKTYARRPALTSPGAPAPTPTSGGMGPPHHPHTWETN